MAYVTTVSISEDDRHFIKENNISLSELVRNNIKKLKEESLT